MKRTLWLALLVTTAATANAQVRVHAPMRQLVMRDDPNAARIGVYLGDNDLRDTAGVLVNSVIKDGPADKAGIKEGDRIAAINGVNLKMSRDDAEDSELRGMMGRRLVRELDKKKPGDDVELRVTSGGSSRAVHVKAMASRDIEALTTPVKTVTRGNDFVHALGDRAVLGLNVGSTPSKRDTLGVFVAAVNQDGPAEKSGVVEGDRIAKINGVDLRVPTEEAGDADLSRARINRLSREMEKLKAGDAVTLSVVSNGRTRDVKVTAAKASELPGSMIEFFPGFNGMFTMPRIATPQIRVMPRGGSGAIEMPDFKDMVPNGEWHSFSTPDGKGSGYYFYDGNGDIRADVRERVEKALEQARKTMEKARTSEERLNAIRDDVKLKSALKAKIDG